MLVIFIEHIKHSIILATYRQMYIIRAKPQRKKAQVEALTQCTRSHQVRLWLVSIINNVPDKNIYKKFKNVTSHA